MKWRVRKPTTASAPAEPASPPKPAEAGIFLQVGAFGSRDNAEALRARMIDELGWPKESLHVTQTGELWRLQRNPVAGPARRVAPSGTCSSIRPSPTWR